MIETFEESNLVRYARKELELAGLFDKDSDYGGMLGHAVMKMVENFAVEGHSGFSANMAIRIFEKVASFEPLTPLTGNDDEWMKVWEETYQNVRCFHVFKDKNGPYDTHGKVFIDPDGSHHTNSRVPITFPYTPKVEYIKREKSE